MNICCKSQGTSKAFGSTSIPDCCYDYTYLLFNLYKEQGFQVLFLSGRPSLGHRALHGYCSHRGIQQSKKASPNHPHARGHQELHVHAQDSFLCMRYKLLTAVNRKWPLTISALTLPEAKLIATEAGPSHLQYIPPTPSLLQTHLRADLASGNKSYKTLSSEQALQQNMKS